MPNNGDLHVVERIHLLSDKDKDLADDLEIDGSARAQTALENYPALLPSTRAENTTSWRVCASRAISPNAMTRAETRSSGRHPANRGRQSCGPTLRETHDTNG